MIKTEGLIYKEHGERILLLREISSERAKQGDKANFLNTGLALVAITKRGETPEHLIKRINSMKAHFDHEAEKAIYINKMANKKAL